MLEFLVRRSRSPIVFLFGVIALTQLAGSADAFPRYMFTWADKPTEAAYVPHPEWSHSSMGDGHAQVEREGLGEYHLRWSGHLHAGFSLESGPGISSRQVTAYGSGADYCMLDVSEVQKVACFDPAGSPVDTKFSTILIGEGIEQNVGLAAVLTSDPAAATYTIDGISPGAPTGDVLVTRTAVGAYEVFFEDFEYFGSDGGNAQVSAARDLGTDPGLRCTVASWSSNRVFVRCFSSAGVPTDSLFSASFQREHEDLGPVAWAWANQPASASYTPAASFAHNPTGGSVTAQRTSAGVYSMTWNGFGGIGFRGGNVQVTAYGAVDRRCKVSNWSGDMVDVRCFDTSGNPVDSQYSVIFRKPKERTLLTRQYAVAVIADPSQVGTIDITGASSNGSGYREMQDPVLQTRLGTGHHFIEFSGMEDFGSDGGVALVSTIRSWQRCKVQNWSANGVTVRCFDLSGSPDDALFNVALFKPRDTNQQIAYVYKSQASALSEVASPFFSHNPSGGSITTTRSSTGFYRVTFSGISAYGADQGAPFVSAYGTGSAYCKIVYWSGDYVDVRCMNSSGSSVDSKFSLIWFKPDETADGFAYALADLPSSTADYAPLPAKAHNPSGEAIEVTSFLTGYEEYRVDFSGFDDHQLYSIWDGHAFLSAVGADSTFCTGRDAPLTAIIQATCTDPTGAVTDSQFVGLLILPVPVPEPSASAILLSGVLLLAAVEKRRSRRARR